MKKIYLSILATIGLVANAFAQPTTAPTTPSQNASDVISFFSDAYTSSAPNFVVNPDWGPNSGAIIETIDGNKVVEMANLTYQGIQFDTEPAVSINVSSMETLHIDLWSADATGVNLSLISIGPLEKPYPITISPGWNSIDIPLSFYAPPVQLDKVFQFKFDNAAPAAGVTIYYDNIYFYKSASTPTITGFTISEKSTADADFTITDPASTSTGAFTYTSSNTGVATISGNTVHIVGTGTTTITASQAAAGGYNAGSATASLVVTLPPPTDAPTTPPARNASDVISIYGEAYTNLTNLGFDPGWGQSTQRSEKTYAGNKVQRMLNFNYQGIELGADVDVSGMDKLHIDVWTPDCTSFEVSLIYKTISGTPVQNEREVTLTPTLNGWNSFDIPLSDYASQDADADLTKVFQLKFTSTDWLTTGTRTVFYDNLYFYTGTVLPVSLSNFEAKLKANEVALNWQTVSESNNKGFAVERSQDGSNWQQLGFVNGHNNASNLNNYSFADKNPVNGVNYYRLVQEDNNGKKTPFDVKSVNFSVTVTEKLVTYPNPVSDKVFVQLGSVNSNNATVSLVDLKGSVLKSVNINQSNSNSTIGISVQGLQNGLYFLVLKDSASVQSTKIIVK